MNNNGSFSYLWAVERHGVALTITSARPSVDSRAPGVAGFCRAGRNSWSRAPLRPSLGARTVLGKRVGWGRPRPNNRAEAGIVLFMQPRGHGQAGFLECEDGDVRALARLPFAFDTHRGFCWDPAGTVTGSADSQMLYKLLEAGHLY